MNWLTIKKTATDAWDELLLLMVFNFIWVVGTVLVIPFPFVTFSLFYIVKDVGEGRGISFAKYFGYGRKTLKPAYIWGGINLVIYGLAYINLRFYDGFEAQWAELVGLFFGMLLLAWTVIQLVSLPIYPRLVEPSFRLAMRNAAVITGRHTFKIILMIIVIAAILLASSLLPVFLILVSFSVVAVLMNNVIEVIIAHELDRMEEAEE